VWALLLELKDKTNVSNAVFKLINNSLFDQSISDVQLGQVDKSRYPMKHRSNS